MIVIDFRIDNMPARMRRNFNRRKKAIMHKIGQEWHQSKLPKHFEHSARQRYNYEPRDPEYIQDKREKRRSTADNVFTGKSRRWAKHSERITATSRQVTIRMKKPAHRPDKMNEEITRVNEQDRKSLESSMLFHAQQAVNEILRESQ